MLIDVVARDFPGQRLYDATNPLFWSPRGLYVLVWRMPPHPATAAAGCGEPGHARGECAPRRAAEASALRDVRMWLRKLNTDVRGGSAAAAGAGAEGGRVRVLVVGTHAEACDAPRQRRLLRCVHTLASLVELTHEINCCRAQLPAVRGLDTRSLRQHAERYERARGELEDASRYASEYPLSTL